MLSVIGAYALNNSLFDIWLMLGFGLFGFALDACKIPTPPLVIGLILGPILDASLEQSLLIGQGDSMIFLHSPISAVLLGIALLSILQATPVFGGVAGLCRKLRRGTRDAAARKT
ncbi:tripartite tricarboxylate transporter permease [Limimaricola litoreus]|uniref:tripartite tricarboxylate transporter permease n=1 Tax=Limimaricola litoreus TaxID=2955316 RepID=UPI0020A1EADF